MDADFAGGGLVGLAEDEAVDRVVLLEGQSVLSRLVLCSHGGAPGQSLVQVSARPVMRGGGCALSLSNEPPRGAETGSDFRFGELVAVLFVRRIAVAGWVRTVLERLMACGECGE